MTARPPLTARAVLSPAPVDAGMPFSVGTAYYHTDYELSFYLRGLRHVGDGRLVVVLAVRPGAAIPPAELPTNVRLIQTTLPGATPAEKAVGWVVPDPFKAVTVAMTGLQAGEGLILLFPDDWTGTPPDVLVDMARRWRSSPHSAEDDVHFAAGNS